MRLFTFARNSFGSLLDNQAGEALVIGLGRDALFWDGMSWGTTEQWLAVSHQDGTLNYIDFEPTPQATSYAIYWRFWDARLESYHYNITNFNYSTILHWFLKYQLEDYTHPIRRCKQMLTYGVPNKLISPIILNSYGGTAVGTCYLSLVKIQPWDPASAYYNGSTFGSTIVWLDTTDEGGGQWSYTFTPNIVALYEGIWQYVAGTNILPFAEFYEVASTIPTLEMPANCKAVFIKLYGVNGKPLVGTVVQIRISGGMVVSAPSLGIDICDLDRECATDETGAAFFALLPTDILSPANLKYEVVVNGVVRHSFSLPSDATEPFLVPLIG